MKKTLVAISSAFSLLLAGGCAMMPEQSKAPSVAVPQQRAELENRDRITATAIIYSVNTDKHELLLKGKGEKLYSVAVGEEVINLSKVKAGAPVELTYYEALATSLEKNTKRAAPSRRELVGSTGAGKKETTSKHIEMVGDVTTINKGTGRVSLQSGQNAVTMKVPTDIDISTLKVGQQVKAVYAQEQAISIAPAKVDKKRKK
jgi:hypothetical protein